MRSGSIISTTERGFTLLETVMAVGLTALLGSLFLLVLTPTLSHAKRGSARIELRQAAAVSLDRLVADLHASAPGAVSLLPSAGPAEPAALALVRVADVTPEGTQVWEETLVVYSWNPADRKLVRREWRGALPGADVGLRADRPLVVDSATLRRLALESNGSDVVLAEGVTRFDVGHSGGSSGFAQPVRLGLRARGAQDESFGLDREVFMRNGT